jgi:hypothetical protein
MFLFGKLKNFFRECQDFLQSILNFIQDNMKSGAFQAGDKSVLDEITEYFLFENIENIIF